MTPPSILVPIERGVLSSFLFGEFSISDYTHRLQSSDFYLMSHQKIYEVMIRLYQNDLPIDEEFIRKELTKDEVSDKELIEIISSNPISNIEPYIDDILENSKKRKLLNLSLDIRKRLHEPSSNYDDIIKDIVQHINQSEELNTQTQTTTELIEQFKTKMIQTAQNGNTILGQKSGLKNLDKKIGAFEDGDLVIIAARPSMGKTAIISTLVNKMLEDNNGVLIESLEMPAIKIIQRLISARSGEHLTDLKKGFVKDIKAYQEALEFYSNDQLLVIHDNSYPSIIQLQSRIKNTLRKNPNIKNIFVDHTGKILLDGKTREDIEIGHITSMLKKIARDYNIRVFLLQQLNRSVENRDDKRPILSDLKNSGNIEEDADIVLGLYRDNYYKTENKEPKTEDIETAQIFILKNRDGEIGKSDVCFEAKCARFLNQSEKSFQKVYL
jgi:replicative DNA helicase